MTASTPEGPDGTEQPQFLPPDDLPAARQTRTQGEFLNEAGDVLARFSAIAHEINPGFANRMMDEVERQAEHQRAMDRAASDRADAHTQIHSRITDVDVEVAPSLIKHADRGQWMAYTLALLIILLGFYAIQQGEAGAAAGIITAGVALAGVVYFRREKSSQPPTDPDSKSS